MGPPPPHATLVQVVKIAHALQSPTSDFTNFPARFTVPAADPWPPQLHGRTIHVAKVRKQYKDGTLPAPVVAALDNHGFVWDAKQHNWNLRLQALRTYKALHDNLLVPYEYTVPAAAPWAKDLWGCKLGVAVTNIRSRVDLLTPDRKAALEALDFVWDSHELTFDIKVLALQTYKRLHGHVHVPFEFKVPDGSREWPATCWKLKLGRAVHDLRCRGDHLLPARRHMLDTLGFVWDSHELNWDMKVHALTTFKQEFGTLLIPQDFVVPSAAPWPERTWRMKLGQAVTNMRFRVESMSDDRQAQLEAIGFIWDYPELRLDAKVLLDIKATPNGDAHHHDAMLLAAATDDDDDEDDGGCSNPIKDEWKS
ncbi:Aste57867_585 [Aphanomyces stellatus]|uniref:Aste57867_585 protein n=1 Tax=Aphanomyces stellatus TaxID=120398 RepID=A0A485K2Z3_9STRA|nr:hypothetical protein As57867_000584 [Aphanomyces stellatus]VFT77810.1 Aste57867_585 [Aphanomyces stellatus]